MKLVSDWLNDYLIEKLSTRALAEALERAGVEVEGIVPAVSLSDSIVVGQVTHLEQHSNADKLKLAKVDVKDATLPIVCGAPNIERGQKVAVALPGAVLPDGSKIESVRLRGVESHGMICSEAELGLSQNHAGIMVLPDTAPIGEKLNQILSGSDVIDTTTAANRADLNGVVGLAREIAAHSAQKVAVKEPEQLSSSQPQLEVEVAAADLTPRYQLVKLDVDATKPSPSWLQQRLLASGTRSINVVVDITNYVMLEYGQPLHAFDAAKVKLPVVVRRAEAGEKLVTLDGETRNLEPSDLLITDASGPIGLAGVMGGSNSEIERATSAIYLESATFNGSALRRTAARLGLRTDASARFERGLPVELAPLALARAVELLTQHADAELVAGPSDHLAAPPIQTRVAVRSDRISALLGLEVSPEQIQSELAKLDFQVEADAAGLTVTPPWWRPDIQHQADVAEEVMKLIGYDRLGATLPTWKPDEITFDQRWAVLWQAKSALRALGLFEVVTYSFISEEQITSLGRAPEYNLKLRNPLSVEQAFLRTDLFPSLLRAVRQNRTYGRRFGLYEISKVYLARGADELPEEPTHLAVIIRAEADSYRVVKAALDRLAREFAVGIRVEPAVSESGVAHPTRSASVYVGEYLIGWLGQLHPALVARERLEGELAYLEIDWNAFVAQAAPRRYREISRFPAVARDLSVLLDRAISWQQVEAVLADYEVSFLSDYYGKDLPPDKKGLALRVSFSDPERTLTNAEADQRLEQIIAILREKFDAALRA